MITKVGQNLFDIAMQEYGSAENIVNLIQDNDLAFDYQVAAGKELIINNANKGNENIKLFMLRNNIKPTHALFGTDYLAKYESDTLIMTEDGQFIIVT